MIGKLTGKVSYIASGHIIIDISGVGYIVHCTNINLISFNLNSEISLFIETHVREDQITLYGFKKYEEKDCFLKLTTVKGIGPKLALQILSSLTTDQIYNSIALKDQKAFLGISGVGPKIITRIFTELKAQDFISKNAQINIKSNNISVETDAVSALVNLGVHRSEAYRVVSKIINADPSIDLNKLIKESLLEVAK